MNPRDFRKKKTMRGSSIVDHPRLIR